MPLLTGAGRRPLAGGIALTLVSVVIAGGAYPRYNRIVYGAPVLALALTCFGAAVWQRRPRGSTWWTAAGCWLLAIAALVVWARPSLAGAVAWEPPMHRAHVLLTLPVDRNRATLFAELQPVEIADCRMERFGGRHDGGYLLCGNLLGSAAAAYSYGIGRADDWGCDVARRLGVKLHQYDCFDPARPSCPGATAAFHNECISSTPRTDENGRHFDTLENQLARNGEGSNHVVVKMDIEGAEWQALLRAPAGLLQRVDQLAIELHGVGLEQHVNTVRRLKEFFHVGNVHFTNGACGPRLDPFPAWAYEVLFVNRRIARPGAVRARQPHPLDAPNLPYAADCQGPATRWSLGGLAAWIPDR